MSGKLYGQARIKSSGREFDTEKGATIDVGGNAAETVEGNHKVLGWTESTKPSVIECKAAFGEGDSVADYVIRGGSVTFECDTGQTYVVKKAWTTTTPKIEAGFVTMTINGDPAEEML